MTISLRLNADDTALVKKYAELHGMTVSEFVRQSVLSRIEDETDIKAFETAYAERKSNPHNLHP